MGAATGAAEAATATVAAEKAGVAGVVSATAADTMVAGARAELAQAEVTTVGAD